MTEEERYEFFYEAAKSGTISIISQNLNIKACRCLVSLGAVSMPFDITHELLRELGIDPGPANGRLTIERRSI